MVAIYRGRFGFFGLPLPVSQYVPLTSSPPDDIDITIYKDYKDYSYTPYMLVEVSDCKDYDLEISCAVLVPGTVPCTGMMSVYRTRTSTHTSTILVLIRLYEYRLPKRTVPVLYCRACCE